MAIFVTANIRDLIYRFGTVDPAYWNGRCKIETSDWTDLNGPNIPGDVLSGSVHEVTFVKKTNDLKKYGLTHDTAIALENAEAGHKTTEKVDLDISSIRAFKLCGRSFLSALLILREDVYDTLDMLLRTTPRENMAVEASIDFSGFSYQSRYMTERISVEQFISGVELAKATKISLAVGPQRKSLQHPHGTETEPRTPTKLS